MSTPTPADGQAPAQDVVAMRQNDTELSALGQAALKYAERGWFVLPCVANEKDPWRNFGLHHATRDLNQIRTWWSSYPDLNIGIALAPSGLLAVDLDTYKGNVSLTDDQPLPDTLEQRSARGGRHAIYAAEDGARYIGKVNDRNIDVKHRGYILVAPSMFEGRPYMWANQHKPAPAPAWLKKPERTLAETTGNTRGDTGRTLAEVEDALRYLDPDAPYPEWIAVLMAIHSEFGDEGLALADEWSAKGRKYSDGIVDMKFGSFSTDGTGVSIAHIFHEAQERGCDLGALAQRHRPDPTAMFDAVAPDEAEDTIFDALAAKDRDAREAAGSDVYPLLRPAELMGRPRPEFLVERHIPQNSLGFLVAAPGVGKSFMAQDLGLTIAAGMDEWHGEKIHRSGDGSVIYIASEGSFDLPLRIGAWCSFHGLDVGAVDRFRVLEAAVNFMDASSVEKLLRSVSSVGVRPALIVVDTVSRALPGADENMQKDMTMFVAACDRLRTAYGCAVMGLHHTSRAGNMRGSTVLSGAGDFIMELEREKEDTGRSLIGTMTMAKQKAAPDGWSYPFKLEVQHIDAEPGMTSLIFAKSFLENASGKGDEAGHHSHDEEAILAAMRFAWDDERPWSHKPQAKGRYAVERMREDFNVPKAVALALLDRWLETGKVSLHPFRASGKGGFKKLGLYVGMTCNVFD